MKTITVRPKGTAVVGEAAKQAMEAAQHLAEAAQMAVSKDGSIILRNIYLYIELSSERAKCRYELRTENGDELVGIYAFSWQEPAAGCFMTPSRNTKLHLL